jgi:flagellar biosynthesis protein FlhF
MRLKIFTAPTITEAMAQIRQAMGDDAVIVSTQTGENGEGVQITAAMESAAPDDDLDFLLSDDRGHDLSEAIERALTFHDVPRRCAAALLDEAENSDALDPTAALVGALKSRLRFAGLTLKSLPRPIMLVGAPGAGKTLTAAKLATRATLAKRAVRVITTDTFRAGAADQLAAYTKILEIGLNVAESPAQLRKLLAGASGKTMTIIDTAGANPFSTEDVGPLAKLINCADIEPVLVCPAGGNVVEAGEVAQIFNALGVRRFVVTRVDMTRRLGAILATATGGSLALSDVSISPHVARGLKSLTPLSLARLLMRGPDKFQSKPSGVEAAQ